MNYLIKTLLSVFALITPFSLAANLAWESDHLKFSVSQIDKSVDAIYKFTNTGEETITISETKTSCGCTVTELEKKVYEPGETGEIKAVFTIGTKVGNQRKVVTVKSNDTANPAKNLVLEVNIKEVIKVTPRFMRWLMKKEKTPTQKDITVQIEPGSGLQLGNIEGLKDQFTYKISPVEGKKGHYTIGVTPLSMEAPARATVKLHINKVSEDPEAEPVPYKTFSLILRVQ